jgi:hypothetical protein
MRYRVKGAGSCELHNLWEWSRQFQGEGNHIRQIRRRHEAIEAETERCGGCWTNQGNFAFPIKASMLAFRLKWG